MRIVAAGADDIDGALRCLYAQHLGTHGRDGPGNLAHRFAAHTQRHQEATDLAGRCIARHDDIEGLARFLEGKGGPGGDLGDMCLQRAHLVEACATAA